MPRSRTTGLDYERRVGDDTELQGMHLSKALPSYGVGDICSLVIILANENGV
eukprot:COSAG02_NODE_7623_length_2928_cov_2.747261_3_plen_52_part_00